VRFPGLPVRFPGLPVRVSGSLVRPSGSPVRFPGLPVRVSGSPVRSSGSPVRFPGLAAVGLGLAVTLTAATLPSAPGTLITQDRGLLKSVSVDSLSDGWAVGLAEPSGSGFALRWNGTAWAQVPLPDAAAIEVSSVSALSPRDAWAVGGRQGNPASNTLVLHWNGTRWKRVPSPSPNPGQGSDLTSVSADSPADAWAVGAVAGKTRPNSTTLALHWDGTAWVRVPTPGPKPASQGSLDGVSADSPSDAWAVGFYFPGQRVQSLALHWDGTSWQRVPIPNPSSTYTSLNGVSADSPDDAWAVGSYITDHMQKGLVLHWNGTSWKQVPVSPGSGSALTSVSADSPSDAWAVGSGPGGNLMLHWNGTNWTKVGSPDPGGYALIQSVSALSPSAAWAVGCVCRNKSERTLVLHWNGTSWKRS
jgi:hypothetical protein